MTDRSGVGKRYPVFYELVEIVNMACGHSQAIIQNNAVHQS